ncbi:PTS glucose transporter subunit IIA [Romboutsia ilealis]|uniref:PTS glucose transporter subunit IIA n=1 Tax=Romboutsia faecis TaxID=2764597 RepID=A0ABR7JN01_9FIRM|nr:PTS glucose transporter subunit IIA [Romboutsia faecis]MBC5996270.1 PTS glucose transporter subunit IIA [Romboutsia faecis]MRN25088.1 PTS glucose transporter subunit IIA [Romboutsia ilealis]
MGLFDFFKKKKETVEECNKVELKGIVCPTNGEILELSEVPDEVFSQKMMGDGFAVKSNDGIFVSPVSGTVEMIFDTKHAIGLRSNDNIEILVHMGIDTVNLNGKGFDVFVNVGDKVKSGDRLAKMDVEYIKENAKSDITPVIFTSLEDCKSVKLITGQAKVKEENRIELV